MIASLISDQGKNFIVNTSKRLKMKLVFHRTRLLHLTVIRRIKKDETLDEIPEITSTSTFAREIYFQVWHGSQAARNKVSELTLQRRLLTYFAAEYVNWTAEIPERAGEKVGSPNGVGPRSGLVDLVSSGGIPESADVTRPDWRGQKVNWPCDLNDRHFIKTREYTLSAINVART